MQGLLPQRACPAGVAPIPAVQSGVCTELGAGKELVKSEALLVDEWTARAVTCGANVIAQDADTEVNVYYRAYQRTKRTQRKTKYAKQLKQTKSRRCN